MGVRASSQDVKAVIDVDPNLDVDPFINTASALVDHVSSEDSQGLLGAELLKSIEIQLAAHFIHARDHQWKQQKTGDASATYYAPEGKGKLDWTPWGANAIALDISGTLASINEGVKTLKITWLGKTKSEKTDYQNW